MGSRGRDGQHRTRIGDLPDAGIFLAARWGMGFAGAAIATFMTWKTAQIRSTQSATGILYILMIFVLFGELSSMILSGRAGASCRRWILIADFRLNLCGRAGASCSRCRSGRARLSPWPFPRFRRPTSISVAAIDYNRR